MNLVELELSDFRTFAEASFRPEPQGITVISGPNGSGKTTLLEAVGYLGTQRSFRGSPREALVRTGAERAIIRASLREENHNLLVEAELVPGGRSRIQLNRQPARTRRELTRAVPVTVFSPDDLALVQGPPAGRRDVLDDALSLLEPMGGALVEEVERILRQRGALLRQSGRRAGADVLQSLDVWDQRLADAGTELANKREDLVTNLAPVVERAYRALAEVGPDRPSLLVRLAYRRSWSAELADALAQVRQDDLRRGVSTTGPHRDELVIELDGRDGRTQASQGEQRCLALALRLAVHQLVTGRLGQPPILLLDDVFSELDPRRSQALLRELPVGQALLTTASPLPEEASAASVVDIATIGRRSGQAEKTPA